METKPKFKVPIVNENQTCDYGGNPIKDSGSTREFSTGAHRDNAVGKGRADLLPLHEVSIVMNDSVFAHIAKFIEDSNVEHLANAIRDAAINCEAYAAGVPDMMIEASFLYEAGALKYGENNWKKGMPTKCYIDSGVRHYLKTLRGDTDEPHYRGFVWNMLCAMWNVNNGKGGYSETIE